MTPRSGDPCRGRPDPLGAQRRSDRTWGGRRIWRDWESEESDPAPTSAGAAVDGAHAAALLESGTPARLECDQTGFQLVGRCGGGSSNHFASQQFGVWQTVKMLAGWGSDSFRNSTIVSNIRSTVEHEVLPNDMRGPNRSLRDCRRSTPPASSFEVDSRPRFFRCSGIPVP